MFWKSEEHSVCKLYLYAALIRCLLVYMTGRGNSFGIDSVIPLYASGPEIDLRVQHILSWKLFSLSSDSRGRCFSYWLKNEHRILEPRTVLSRN